MKHLSLRDRLVGEAGAFVTRHPVLRRRLHGQEAEGTALIDFHTARTPLEGVALPAIAAYPDLHPRPPQSEWPIRILAVGRVALANAMAGGENGRLGYAWSSKVLGRAVLFGYVPEDDLPEPGSPFACGVSVGAEPLRGGLVVVWPDRTLSSVGQSQTPAGAGLPELALEYNLPAAVPEWVPRY